MFSFEFLTTIRSMFILKCTDLSGGRGGGGGKLPYKKHGAARPTFQRLEKAVLVRTSYRVFGLKRS